MGNQGKEAKGFDTEWIQIHLVLMTLTHRRARKTASEQQEFPQREKNCTRQLFEIQETSELLNEGIDS